MLNITFEFVGGPNDGMVEHGILGKPSDAERHYLFSHHGQVGQQFSVASERTVEAIAAEELPAGETVPRYDYVVTDRAEQGDSVWVRAEYVPQWAKQSSQPDEHEPDLDGCLLIASPRLVDHFFSQSVILMLHQDGDEALGVILNRPAHETVGQLWEQISETPCENLNPVHIGGPAEGPVLALHGDADRGEAEVAPGVFLVVEQLELEQTVVDSPEACRLIVGTARWEGKQLADELAAGVWLKIPATRDLVFEDPEQQWRNALRRYGRSFMKSIGVKHVPDDARLN